MIFAPIGGTMERQQRVVSIQDISCFGKCSETVALPILSAAGVETVILPTALLSTHTGGLTGYTFLSLEDQLDPITDHWKSLGLPFDGIVTGYVGSRAMAEKILSIERKLSGKNTRILSDPAMADNGKLYPGFDLEYVKAMTDLCARADVVLLNITEACMMTNTEYHEGPWAKEEIEALLKRLCALGPGTAILTGVSFEEGKLGAGAYDAAAGKTVYAMNEQIEGYYHGTGDIFACAFYGAYFAGKDLQQAIQIAVDFTHDAIRRTYDAKTDIRFGVNFEAGLGEYASRIHG